MYKLCTWTFLKISKSSKSVDFNPSGLGDWKTTSNLYTVEMFVYHTNRNASQVDADYDDTAIWAVGDTYSSINVGSTGKIRMNQYDQSTTRNFYQWDSNYILPLNQWVHMAFVWGSSTIKWWADGVYKGSVPSPKSKNAMYHFELFLSRTAICKTFSTC